MDFACDKCGYRFDVSPEAYGLSADCPHCGATMDIPDEQASLVGPEVPPQTPRTVTVIAEPLPASEPMTQEQADQIARQVLSGGQRLEDLANAITPATRSFPADVLASFPILFAGQNRFALLGVALMDLLALLCLVLISTGVAFLEAPGFFFLLLPVGWFSGVFFRVCQATVAGDDDMKIAAILEEGVVGDLVIPAVRMLATVAVSLLPLTVYWLVLAFVPLRPPVEVDLALLAVCAFLWPAAVLLVVIGDSVTVLDPRTVLRVVTVSWRPYLATWAGIVVTCAVPIAGGWLLGRADHARGRGVALATDGTYLLLLILSISLILAGRTIGLLYRHFKKRLPFEAE